MIIVPASENPIASSSSVHITKASASAAHSAATAHPAAVIKREPPDSALETARYSFAEDSSGDDEGCLYIATPLDEAGGGVGGNGGAGGSCSDSSTLDYVINDDGSCTCKLCGERVQSRTHWYRHKYKVG